MSCEHPSSERPLCVDYVTMAFPHPSEPFAGSDARALTDLGVRLRVHSLRPQHPLASNLVESWRLQRVIMTHNSLRASLSGLWHLVKRPRLIKTAAGLLMKTATRPRHWIRTCALLPRALDILAAIETERPDVVHAFWGHYPTLVTTLVQQHAPTIATSVFLGAYDMEERYPLTREAISRSDFAWTHACANRAALIAAGARAERVAVTYRGIDMTRLPSPGAKTPGSIVTVGRLIPSKGFDLVIKAFHGVLEAHPNASLTIIGDGAERAGLERMCRSLGIADSVKFLGRVHHRVVLEELNSAEIMVFLSHKTSERLPNAVKEAMACRCYCVVSDTPGITEMIPDASCGLVVDQDDPITIASRICAALDDPAMRERVGNAARRFIQDHFDTSETMKRYVRAWSRAPSFQDGSPPAAEVGTGASTE